MIIIVCQLAIMIENLIVRWKVGQGQPFNQGCNNEINRHNCYNLSSSRT